MDFRLVPKSVTLYDFERHNGRVVCVISPNSVTFGAYYVKVVGDTPTYSASEMQSKVSSGMNYNDICKESLPARALK